MAMRRQTRLQLTLSMVLGLHLIFIWLLVSSPQLSIKTKSGSLQLVWITRPVLSDTASERETKTERPTNPSPRHRVERTAKLPSIAPRSNEEDNAIHPAPDWTEELQLVANDAVAKELAQKRHEMDFAHAFPVQPKKSQQFAWDYAATHRIEAIPGGGLVVHINDNCVLLIFPLPLIGCGIGKHPANGDLFEHRHD
jgi:hypothetical protein